MSTSAAPTPFMPSLRSIAIVVVMVVFGAAFGVNATSAAVATGFSVNNPTATEGDTVGLPVQVTFIVTRSGDTTLPATVEYRTNDGSAKAGTDYTTTSGTLSFAPGETQKTVDVALVNDTTPEPTESFFLDLSNAVNAPIVDARGEATVTDNDADPTVSVSNATVTEGNTGTTPATFTISLSKVSEKTVTVEYSTADGTATAGSDYAAVAPTTVTFAPGEQTKQVTVNVTGDTTDEADETFQVNLSNPLNATLGTAQGTGTIVDDDAPPSASVNDPAPVTEEAGGPVVFTVTLSTASAKAIKVDFATANGTAVAGQDYTAKSGTLTFEPGQTSKTVDVALLEDELKEPDESFTLNLSLQSGPLADAEYSNVTIAKASGTGTIADDGDAGAAVTVSDVDVIENAGTAVVTVTVTGAHETVTVTYSTADGTATAPSDYLTRSGTLTFDATESEKTITVPIVNDSIAEPLESFFVNLTAATGATVTDPQGEVRILNDEGIAPSVTIDDNLTIAEGDSGSTMATFTLRLSEPAPQPVTVTYQTEDGSAKAGSDYTSATGTVTFNTGESTKTIAVSITGDTADEVDENFFVNLTQALNATIADPRAEGRIIDNDIPPAISVSDVAVDEGNSGTTNAAFVVSLSAASGQQVTVNYTTTPGTATAGADYTSKTDTVTFDPGETSKTVDVPVLGDTRDEEDETFFLDLTAPTNATISDARGAATIRDDDNPPTLSVGDDNDITEGTAGSFVVSLSAPSDKTVTVSYSTANGTATAATDYTEVAPTQLTFAPGEVTKTVTVNTFDDAADEASETFFVNLTSPSNATIADGQGTATIIDNDGEPSLSIDDVNVAEGNAGSTTATFTVRLLPASNQQVTVNYATADGTATTPTDYLAATGQLTFAAGETEKTVNVTVVGDTTDESNETFIVTLSGAVNATLEKAVGTGTILDDDGPTITISDRTVTEGDAGTASAAFIVTLSAASPQSVTVRYATANGTATAPSDFTATDGTLTIPAGETTSTIEVPIVGDTTDEPNETFTVNLSDPTNATLGDAQGVGTINDDDALPGLTVNDVTVTETNTGTTIATFTVSLTNASSQSVTVDYTTVNDTATAPGDYTATAGTLTFAGGETVKNVPVTVFGDTVVEGDETFRLVLSNPSPSATLADAEGTATIRDNDGAASFSINDTTVTEGTSADTTATLRVLRSGDVNRTASVAFGTANRTAVAPGDYTATSGTLTFAIGETEKTVAVTVRGDSIVEGQENFAVVLSNASGATIADVEGVVTITDDDTAPAPGPKDAAQGYSLVGEDGSLYAFGTAKNVGDMKGKSLNAPIIGVAYTPGGNGYWLVAKDGGIFTFGNAEFFGSMGDKKLNSPVIGMAASPTGKGYWLFAGDGGIFTFGDAEFFGSMGDKKLNQPVINMEPLESGNGYWLVAGDGGIFTFGQGEFFGSMGDQKLNQPVFDMTSTDTDKGYWLVARDGGVFSFGDAAPKFYGSAANANPRSSRVVGMDSTPGSLGYWIADATGRVLPYGNAQNLGDRAGATNPAPMIAFASVPDLKA